MVCKVFFAKNFRKKAGNRETNCPECFLRPQRRAMPPKHGKRQTFHSTSEEAEKYKPFGLKTRFLGADLLPAKLLRVLHYGQKKLRIPVLCKGE